MGQRSGPGRGGRPLTARRGPGPGSARSRLLIAGLVLALGLAGVARARSAELPRSPGQPPVDVLVQGAVDVEIQALLAALEGREEIQLAAFTFWRGKLGEKSVVVSRTDAGPINAAAATTLGVLAFRPALVINQGTAGAHVPELRVFDIVVGEATTDIGAFYTTPAGAGEGSSPARWAPIYHRVREEGREQAFPDGFPGDPPAMQVALATPYSHGRVVKGVIGSAYQFNNEVDRLFWLNRTYKHQSEDMESVFSAGAARALGTRFLAIRVIANSAFYAPRVNPATATAGAEFVAAVIRRLP
jgi:adenosylhomocysteine nucleosidase